MFEFAERMAQIAKRDKQYKIDRHLGARSLGAVIIARVSQIIRGLWCRLFFAQAKGMLFVGRGVVIQNAHQISSHGTLTIRDYVSIQALSTHGIEFGNNVMIGRYTTIECTGVIRALGEGLSVGENSNFGEYNYVGVRGPIRIGSNVLMGPRVSLHAENHVFQDPSIPIRLQGEERIGIVIEDDCWIGSGSTILDGVTVGTGSVIAAGAVVTRDVPAFSVVAGVPAKIVKQRGQAS